MPASLLEYLERNYREQEPDWLYLAQHTSDPQVRKEFLKGFLQSRIVYYPGAGRDGQPIKLFNRAHAAHAYIYVDYGISREQLHHNLTPNPEDRTCGFRGYRTVTILDLEPHELGPWPPVYHLSRHQAAGSMWFVNKAEAPYAALYVLERLPEFSDDHGARRFAILSLNGDGFATYDALFCQDASQAKPFCVVVQDHGFGGNWDRFDRGYKLEEIARMANVWPELLLVAYEVSRPWRGYELPDLAGDDLEPERGGMHSFLRALYHRSAAHRAGGFSDAGRHRPSPNDKPHRGSVWWLEKDI
ncbi:MAG: hypothetical protein ACPL7M_01605 [Bryobacteraceae bacterium]